MPGRGWLNTEETLKVAEDHEKYQAEDRAQDWELAAKDDLQPCAFSMNLTSGDILNCFTLQTKRKMRFSRGHMGGIKFGELPTYPAFPAMSRFQRKP
ncbi:hypothetical protein GRJ2_002417200 [Grus japonensis]|uniref:Uncharacterized protein n=1 Tax=Grus japonensis TaxID=30415 RepID=A0ABC9XP69_GRUJA